jgi:uncharacterized protein YdcH (DUF465 family)
MIMKEEEIKEHLMTSSPEFRLLAEEHTHFEVRLQELHGRHHMSEQDHLDEIAFKKKKLQIKDQMNSMIHRVRLELEHQHT